MLKREERINLCYGIREGIPTLFPRFQVLQTLGVEGIIRIHAKDYALFPDGNRFTHFNLEYSGHKPGSLYVLPRILRPGYLRKNGDERPPLLDFSNCYLARCLSIREKVAYKSLLLSGFSSSLKNIKTVPDLQREILWRYTHSLPDSSSEEILERGVSITELEITGKTPPCAF